MKIYRHYGADKFDPDKTFSDLYNPVNFKPPGFWASPYDCEYGWKEFCEDQDFRTDSLESHFDFVLASDARILDIRTPSDVLPYTKKDPYAPAYSSLAEKVKDPTVNRSLDYCKLMNDFDGMEVHISENPTEFWWSKLFYGYDVDSLVLWNLDVVRVVDRKE